MATYYSNDFRAGLKIMLDGEPYAVEASEFGICGDMNNKYQMGVSTNLKYKGISLGIDFDIRQGGVMYSRTKDINYFTGNAIQTAYNDRNPLIVPNSKRYLCRKYNSYYKL